MILIIHYEIYEKLGAHKTKVNGEDGVYFAVWAPNAQYVNVIGSFNGWDIFKDKMGMSSLEYARLFKKQILVPIYEEYAK